MACPTYSLSATQRSKLQSSVKQAAYRHAEKYVDELYGKTQNFTSKAHQEEVQSLGMFVPFGEEMPLLAFLFFRQFCIQSQKRIRV